ncbi:hypothetical protein [Actinokineospora inagensis]|uniref:hypothetical protein n=1 Tax=Actinokineospora inagensis TaxID=103730 RepID=UPI00047C47A1|nr:hypothetical protein [Actinokineospora inagensis]
MDTTELARAMRAATAEIRPDPAFVPAVLRGAWRRRLRRRIAITVALTAVVAATGTLTVTVLRVSAQDGQDNQGVAMVTDPVYVTPARGQLASDETFTEAATAAFSNQLPVPASSRLGQPHVYWAGATDAGKIAVVMQPVHQAGEAGWRGEGVVGVLTGSQPKLVVATRFTAADLVTGLMFLYGPGDKTALALSQSPTAPMVSPNWIVADDNRGRRYWDPMVDGDGAWWTRVPDPTAGLRVVAGDPNSTYQELRVVRAAKWPADPVQAPVTPEPDPTPPVALTFPGTDQAQLEGDIRSQLTDAGFLDPLARSFRVECVVDADLPTGLKVTAVEISGDSPDHNVYLAVRGDGGNNTWTYGNPVTPGSHLLVRARLPEDAGWLLAARNTHLRYRTDPDQPWQDAGDEVAWVPAAATQAELTTDNREPVVENIT